MASRPAILANSFAFSRVFNDRNLEFYWYGLWNMILHSKVVETFPNWLVFPQFILWLAEMGSLEERGDSTFSESGETLEDGDDINRDPWAFSDEDQGTDEGQDLPAGDSSRDVSRIRNMTIEPGDVSIEVGDTESEAKDDESNEVSFGDRSNILGDLSNEFADLSMVSGRTIAVPGAHSRLPDFAVLQLASKRSTHPRYDGCEITNVYPHILCEIKSCPKRHLTEDLLREDIESNLAAAQDDLFEQAAFAFTMYPHMDRILCIAAAGPYWSYATLRPIHIKRTVWHDLKKLNKYVKPPPDSEFRVHRWSSFVRLNQPSSNKKFGAVLRRLKDLEVREMV